MDSSWIKLCEALEYCDHKKIAEYIREEMTLKICSSVPDDNTDDTIGKVSINHITAELIINMHSRGTEFFFEASFSNFSFKIVWNKPPPLSPLIG